MYNLRAYVPKTVTFCALGRCLLLSWLLLLPIALHAAPRNTASQNTGPQNTAVQAPAQKPIRLGGVFSLSGFGAKGGVGELRAAELAVEEINAAGGIGGRKVELLVEDNRSDLATAISAYQKLVQVSDVDAVVGPNWSEFAEVVAPVVERLQVPTITPSGVLHPTAPRRFFFTLMPGPLLVQKHAAREVEVHLKARHVVGLVQDNSYLLNAWQAARTLWADRITTEEVLLPASGAIDYRTILLRAAQRPGTVLFASLLPGQYAPLLKARAQLGVSVPVYAVDILYDEGAPQEASLNTQVSASDFKVLGSSGFRRRFEARFGAAPLNYAAKAYDAVYMLAEGVMACGRRNPECIASIDRTGESGHLKFDEAHVVVVEGDLTDIYEFTAGKWRIVDR